MESSNVQRGVQLFELGRYKDAVAYFQEDIQHHTSKYYLAYCYFYLHELEKAKSLCDELLSESPLDSDVLFLKAQLALEENNETSGLEFINEAISIHPFNADYFGLKASIYLSKKEFEQALKDVNTGLNIEPRNTFCLNLRAQLLTKLGRKEEASETVENLLQANPEDSYSHANVGWVALEQGDTKKSLHHFKQALQLNPNDAHARTGMSTALKSKNFFYKWYLKYEFWMANQSSKNQWVFIIGIYLAYRFGIKMLSAGGMSYLIMPIFFAYLTFAMGGWIMESLSNSILNFDNYGKYLLSDDERKSGYTFGVLFILGMLSVTAFYVLSNDYYLLLAVTFFCALIPLPRAFLQHTKNSKLFSFGFGSLMIAVGTVGFLIVPDLYTLGAAVVLMLVAFTWIANFIK